MATDNIVLAKPGARFVSNWLYDMESFPGDSTLLDILKAVFVCAAGDGEFSKVERDYAVGYLDAVGVPDSLFEFVRTYPAKDTLEDLVKSNQVALNNDTKMAIIFTAMLIAGSDGYADGEHASIVKMSGRMGVSEDFVNKIRAQYERDLATNKERINVVNPGATISKDSVKLTRPGAIWFSNWMYGLDCLPGDKSSLEMIKAILVCAAGDGVLSQVEREYFLGYLDALGTPDSLQEFVKTYPAKDNLDELMKDNPDVINEATKRAIIYGAIFVSGADGYAESEHAQVLKMGLKLGADVDTVNKIRAQYERDIKDRKDRIALLFPGQHPWKK